MGEKFAIKKLNNGNYMDWEFEVRHLLTREKMWKYVDPGTPPNPLTDAWTQGDAETTSTICLLIEPGQRGLVKDKKTAKAAWEALKSHHVKVSLTCKVSLLKKLCNKNYHDGTDMQSHLLEMESLFDQLENAGQKLEETLKVAMVLRSLPDSFDALCTALESRDDADLTMELIKGKLIDRANKIQEGSVDTVAMKAYQKSKGKPEKKVKSGECWECGKTGHQRKDCPVYSKKKPDKDHRAHKAKDDDAGSGSKTFSLMIHENSIESRGWIVDSGASSHLCNDRSLFYQFQESSSKSVSLADGKQVKVGGEGCVQVETIDTNGNTVKLKLSKVLFVPDLETNLMSVVKLTEKGVSVNFMPSGCNLLINGEIIGKAMKVGNLYCLEVPKENVCFVKSAHEVNCQHIWHKRLGHRDSSVIPEILKKNLVENFNPVDCGIHEKCESCLQGKSSRKPFPKKAERKSKDIMDLIHTDVCGPSESTTPSGNRYFMTIIDDFSRYTFVCMLKEKSEVAGKIKEFVEFAKTQFGRKPKKVRSDQGGEYSSADLKKFYRDQGIKVEYTAAYSPQQNGVAERRNRYLVEMARAMLNDADLDKKYWAEAVSTACYLQNILPSSSVDKTPHEILFQTKPSYKDLKVFGCTAHVHVPKQKRKKFDMKSRKLVFVGYSPDHKAYRFLDPTTSEITISRDATFLENKFSQVNPVEEESKKIDENVVWMEFSSKKDPSWNESEDEECFGFEESEEEEEAAENQEIADQEPPENPEGTRKSQRSNKGVPPQRLIETFSAMDHQEPRSFREAMISPKKVEWKMAMEEEIRSLIENQTWELVVLPPGKKTIGCKWIYKMKTDENGKIVRYKARLVALGFSQKFGVDYDLVFAPVVRQITLRTVLAIASCRRMRVKHVDIKTAYLYGDLDETIYMRQPPGLESEDKELVCILKKSLYGLKQGARMWNRKITGILKICGFVASSADPCLFIKNCDGKLIFILIYVDDVIIIYNKENEFEKIVQELMKNFKLTNLGEISYFLGIQIERINEVFYLNQKAYIEKVADQFGLMNAKPSKIPMSVGYHSQQKEERIELKDNKQFQSLVGCLLFIAVNTRPDISISVSILSRNVKSPTQDDWTEGKRIVKYLNATKDMKLKIGNSEREMMCYVDADWAGNVTDYKSTSGFIIKLGEGLIGWGCKKQSSVALSSTDAECIAMSECCRELSWLFELLKCLEVKPYLPIIVHEDNQSLMKLLVSERVNHRSKHIGTRYNYIKDIIQKNLIEIKYCPTEEMVADILTKPLSVVKFQKFRSEMGIQMH